MKTQRTQQSCLLLALSEENPPVTGGFPSQKASNVENVSLSWHHPVINTSMVSCQKGPTRHAYAWQIGPFWQHTLKMQTLLHCQKRNEIL